MTKFLKRIGTKKINYEYEVHIEKIEIKLPSPCQLSVLMKRGQIFNRFFCYFTKRASEIGNSEKIEL